MRKQSLQGNVYGAGTLTGNGEDVPGIIPRAARGELKRLRDRRLEFTVMDPTVLQYMNSKRKQAMLLEAFEVIRGLQSELEKLTGLKTPLKRKNAKLRDAGESGVEQH